MNNYLLHGPIIYIYIMHCSCTIYYRYVCFVISLKLKIIELNLTIAILLKTILRARGLWPSGAEIGRDIFACSQLHTIRFLAIYMKTERFRALKLPCVPTNLTIAIILNPILRGLRPSEVYIALCSRAQHLTARGTFFEPGTNYVNNFFEFSTIKLTKNRWET